MEIHNAALIGFGVIGAPLAHKLFLKYQGHFFLIATGARRTKLESGKYVINGDAFAPTIISERSEIDQSAGRDCGIELLFVCVKNYDLKASVQDIRRLVTENTIIMPLQNGIYAYDFFCKEFPDNIVLQGYIQGPNTEITGFNISYQNSGVLHIGSDHHPAIAESVVAFLKAARVKAEYEPDIRHMVWKKWMLNVAGNSITALTGADYSQFKMYDVLPGMCIQVMHEFLRIADAEGVALDDADINDIINYYISYDGSKQTSMLIDVLRERKTENDYLAGTAVELAQKHGIQVPMITALYYLMEAKENVYMDKQGVISTENLFNENVTYSTSLRAHMIDIDAKMSRPQSGRKANADKLDELLNYTVRKSKFYSCLAGKANLCITDFPVMDKIRLKQNYEEILVHDYDSLKTHQMYTSGSNGMPLAVVQDLAKRERNIADLKYFGALAGYKDREPMCYLRARPTADFESQERDNIWQLDICKMSEKNMTDYYHVMVEKKCVALVAYASTLETAVDFWSKRFSNITSIRTIISTSEALTDRVRNKLHAFFGKDVKIYARYSNAENGILGQETGESGVYSLNWASYYFEILKMDEDVPVEEGNLGRVVITDLYNKAFPMIRYDTGDLARMDSGNGDSYPALTELYGRQMDLIYDTRGEVVSPFLLCRTMRFTKGIKQWQFIQENETKYTLKVVAEGDKPSCLEEVESFEKTLGDGAAVRVVYVDSLPVLNTPGQKLIVSNLKKNQRQRRS